MSSQALPWLETATPQLSFVTMLTAQVMVQHIHSRTNRVSVQPLPCRYRRVQLEAAVPLHLLAGGVSAARPVRPAPPRFGSLKALTARLPQTARAEGAPRPFLSAQLAARPPCAGPGGPMPLPGPIVSALAAAPALASSNQVQARARPLQRQRRKASKPR